MILWFQKGSGRNEATWDMKSLQLSILAVAVTLPSFLKPKSFFVGSHFNVKEGGEDGIPLDVHRKGVLPVLE